MATMARQDSSPDITIMTRISKNDWTMKKMIKFMTVVAVAAMGLSACNNEFDEPNHNNNQIQDEVVVTFVAEPEATRTSVDTSSDDAPIFSWNDSESFKVLELTDALAFATNVAYEKVEGKANITATFNGNAGKEEYKYVTVYPASGFVGATDINNATLQLPANQTMAATSYDPDADLMVSKVVTTDVQPTDAQQVQFTRVAAVVKMTLKNFGVELGDEVEKVIFTATGKKLAGKVTADLTNPHEFTTTEECVDSVTVTTTSKSDVYFTVLPTTLEAGDSYTITVITNKKLYVKTGQISEGKSLSFEAGMVNRFGVKMDTAPAADKWVLVRDASTLKQGDIVTFAAKDYNYVVSAYSSSNYPYASKTEVVKFGDYLYHPDADNKENRIQKYILAKRFNNRTAFDFYNGTNDYSGDDKSGFLVAPGSSSKYLKLNPYYTAYSLFDISIADDGVATIVATDGEKGYKQISYNHSTSSATSRYFCCNENTATAFKDICLYKLAGEGGGILPTVAANFEVPDADEKVAITDEATTEATPIEEVVFNYVGDWTITAEATEEWLRLEYDATLNALTYTADANLSTPRTTTVTVTASLEGEEDIEKTFTVIQKGLPVDYTIADFKALTTNDYDITYKLTGLITAISTSSGNAYTLSDGNGNTASITYLYTEDNQKVYNNTSIGLEVGDVVTVTTVRTGSAKGGSSTYHSTYKGHYGLDVAIEGLAAEYTGGSVVINATTRINGNIAAPAAVEAEMAQSDFAVCEFDGSKATVTFTSENTTTDAREAAVTFTYGLITKTVIAEQGVNPANRVGWDLVTDASKLAVGDQVVIVALKSERALGCLASTASATSGSNFPSVEVDKSGNVVYDVEKAGALVFTITEGKNEGTFSFKFTHNSADYYLYTASSALRGRKTSDDASNYCAFNVTINAENGDATIQSGYPRLVKFNSAAASLTFMVKKTTDSVTDDNAVAIYKKPAEKINQ